jgi:hypothetical protein
MNRTVSLIVLSWAVFTLPACHAHIEMQYTPEQYARLRGIELVTTPPARPYEPVADVEGSGGRFTAKETMINAMIDAARKAGADALIPLEFAGQGSAAAGMEQFVFTENNRTVTRGRAIKWVSHN